MTQRANVSLYEDHKTATTDPECAEQRAKHLSNLRDVWSVLEMCVGPSLKTLRNAYYPYSIKVTGNDIDSRWIKTYPEGPWIIKDCMEVVLDPFDAIVFAPPLSKGCSGKREDSLMIDQVFPRYREFLRRAATCYKILCLVLPARSVATKQDRVQLYSLINHCYKYPGLYKHDLVPLTVGRRRITKYYDLYLDFRP